MIFVSLVIVLHVVVIYRVIFQIKIINLGYSGNNMAQMMDIIEQIKAVHPQKLFIMAGTNDLAHLNMTQMESRWNNLFDVISDSVPDTKIFVQSVLPVSHSREGSHASNTKIAEANNVLKKIAAERNLVYIDLYSRMIHDGVLSDELTIDGIHLKPAAYDIWANAITQYINE